MNKEEKEAIEKLTIKAITSSAEAPNFPNLIVMKKDLQTLLNYIDKLQKENEKLKYEHLEADELIKALREENIELIAYKNKLINYIAIRENKIHEEVCKEFDI